MKPFNSFVKSEFNGCRNRMILHILAKCICLLRIFVLGIFDDFFEHVAKICITGILNSMDQIERTVMNMTTDTDSPCKETLVAGK